MNIKANESESPEIRKYKKKFTSDILCAALWGVNLLIGTETGLMLLDRSGQGKGKSIGVIFLQLGRIGPSALPWELKPSSLHTPRGISSLHTPRGISSLHTPRGIPGLHTPRGISCLHTLRGIPQPSYSTRLRNCSCQNLLPLSTRTDCQCHET